MKIFISFLIFFFAFGVLAQTGELSDPGLIPDSPFYFLKTWKESIQTFFTFGAENKAKQYLHLAEVRLAEYQKMLDKGTLQQVQGKKLEIAEKTLTKYQNQLNRAISKTEELKTKGKDIEELKTQIEQTIQKHLEILQENLQKAPEQAKKGIENAMENSQKHLEKISEFRGEMRPDLGLDLAVAGNLKKVGSLLIIRLVMTPVPDLGNEFFATPAMVRFNLPDALELAEGSDSWEIYFTELKSRTIEFKVKSLREGNFTVSATAAKQNSGEFTKSVDIRIGEAKDCTQEAKLCPDGSYVGRTGPNCEFAVCPEIKDETAGWKTYRNEEYLVSFKYPHSPEWKFYKDSEQSFSVEKSVAIPGAPKGEFAGGFYLRIFPNQKDFSLIEWFNKNHKRFWSNPADTSFNLNELPAIKVYESIKDRGGQAFSSLAVYTKNNDTIYSFECYGIDEYLKEICDKILDSISFK